MPSSQQNDDSTICVRSVNVHVEHGNKESFEHVQRVSRLKSIRHIIDTSDSLCLSHALIRFHSLHSPIMKKTLLNYGLHAWLPLTRCVSLERVLYFLFVDMVAECCCSWENLLFCFWLISTDTTLLKHFLTLVTTADCAILPSKLITLSVSNQYNKRHDLHRLQ